MKYTTTDELEHFDFGEAYIGDVQAAGDFFHLVLDNVTILPENSCNRDIRTMRTNELLFKLEQAEIAAVIKEGFKVYDADGRLVKTCDDTELPAAKWQEVIKSFVGGMIYSLKKEKNQYEFIIDAPDEATYALRVTAAHDVESWDRFLNL